MREFSGIARTDEHTLRVSFVGTVWHDAATRKNEVEQHTQLAFTIDGVDCDRDYLEATFGVPAAESLIDRAVDNAIHEAERARV